MRGVAMKTSGRGGGTMLEVDRGGSGRAEAAMRTERTVRKGRGMGAGEAAASGNTKVYTVLPSLIGELWVAGTDGAITDIRFGGAPGSAGADPRWSPRSEEEAPAAVREAAAQLRAYFGRRLKRFDLPLAAAGTPFQREVWAALCQVPWGETVSYGELARRIARPGASRAVGLANGSNPIPIVIPCHRVIGADGTLTGFGGGLPMKEALLRLEGARGFADDRQPQLLDLGMAGVPAAGRPSLV